VNKKRTEQLESLLDWEREGGRLPDTIKLFNRQIGETINLAEVMPRTWILSVNTHSEDGNLNRQVMLFKHESLVQLGLTIIEAVKVAEDRFISSKG